MTIVFNYFSKWYRHILEMNKLRKKIILVSISFLTRQDSLLKKNDIN